MATNPTSKTAQCQTPAECKFNCANQSECRLAVQADEGIVPLCPKCAAEISAASVQMQFSPNPKPPLPPNMIVIMVVCRNCHCLLPIQTILLIDPTAVQQEPAPPLPEPKKIWSPH